MGVKAKFKSGDIFRIPLPNGLGYAFAKGILLSEWYPDIDYPVLLKIYNKRESSKLLDLSFIEQEELILEPLLVAGINSVIGKDKWEIVTNVQLDISDHIIPDYKYFEPSNSTDETKAQRWFYIKDANINGKKKSTYENVKHLELFGAIGVSLLPIKVCIALLKNEGLQPSNFFKLDSFVEQQFYREVSQIEPYYKQSLALQGKAIQL